MVWLKSAVPFIGILLLFQRTTAQLIPQQYHLINVSLTWYEAQSFCRVKYTDLATVNNMDDKNKLVNTLGSNVTYCWIGLQKGITHRWMWSDGRGTAQFFPWASGEPDNSGGNEWCGQMFQNGGWNDGQCGGGSVFVCYELQQDGSQKYIYYTATNSWENSQEVCRGSHTDLAYVSTKAENSEIANGAGTFNTMWIGLFNDVWMWSDGSGTSFRYWLSGSPVSGDCASVAVSQQGRWIGADCNQKAVFACGGDLKLKRMVIRITIRFEVDLTNSIVRDTLLKKLDTSLRQKMTDFNLSWQSDQSGHVFQRQEQLEATKKPGC
ncbi:hypothetical protein PFLUV_G00167750 [Perca fluviatilis]|uniref:C-type lectin domain-containing protein n=1 Tax=Perca fluviatilis TaxID=8168 RepID=A0A6A5EIT4_PERFL|nr:macrophage mannose receptor 1-like [Perca fluviatilis]KAF1380800.1 hypothetical protein PFLUV_G00167750 [Perca fluviatilis]